MKNRNPLTKLALLFTVLLTLGAAAAQANILPLASLDLAPVGLTGYQNARLNLVNLGAAGGMFINLSLIDGNGNILERSAVTLPLGQTVSFAYCPGCSNDTGQPMAGSNLKVRVHVDILNPDVP